IAAGLGKLYASGSKSYERIDRCKNRIAVKAQSIKPRCIMRSIWKGYIRFSLVTIPIRIYNAVSTEETIRFNQLHKEDNGAIGYDKKCKKCGKVLTTDEICKGYQFEPE